MKRYLVPIMTLLMAVCLLAGCGEAKVYWDVEETITTRVNREFIVSVGANPPSGYDWVETHDESLLELVGGTFKVNEEATERLGQIALEQHFRFKALKKGKTEVILDLKDPSRKISVRQEIFNVSIE